MRRVRVDSFAVGRVWHTPYRPAPHLGDPAGTSFTARGEASVLSPATSCTAVESGTAANERPHRRQGTGQPRTSDRRTATSDTPGVATRLSPSHPWDRAVTCREIKDALHLPPEQDIAAIAPLRPVAAHLATTIHTPIHLGFSSKHRGIRKSTAHDGQLVRQ